MTRYYLDSSVAVRILLGHSATAASWFDTAADSAEDSVVSSRLLRTEVTRVLRRENLPIVLRDEVLDHIATIPMSDTVLAEAEAIVPHIKTLDAIHLASLIHSGLDATIVTHDASMKRVAELVGFPILDPIGE